MNSGYIKLWRKSLEKGMMQNSKLWTFWTWCLLRASYKERSVMIGFQKINIKPGQFIMGRKSAAKELKQSEKNIRTCLKSLETMGNLAIKTTNKFTVVTIVNWELYQSNDNINGQQSGQQVANGRPTSGQQVATNKKVKKDNKDKNVLKNKEKELLFEKEFWPLYPKKPKQGKEEARKAWLKIKLEVMPGIISKLKEQLKSCYFSPESKYIKNAQGYLNGKRWEDEINNKGGGGVGEYQEGEWDHGYPEDLLV